jgi:translation initiation factor IF-2
MAEAYAQYTSRAQSTSLLQQLQSDLKTALFMNNATSLLVTPAGANGTIPAANGSQATQPNLAAAAILASLSIDSNKKFVKVPVVIKADVGGSIEAIRQTLQALIFSDDDTTVQVDIVYSDIGSITTSDITNAEAIKADILAFNIPISPTIEDHAHQRNVKIYSTKILYDIINYMTKKLQHILSPTLSLPGKVSGIAEVKKIFKLGKSGKVAGCYVKEGQMSSNSAIRVVRAKKTVVFDGYIHSLKVVKEEKTEVESGNECGIVIKGFDDFEEGDMLQCYSGSAGSSGSSDSDSNAIGSNANDDES